MIGVIVSVPGGFLPSDFVSRAGEAQHRLAKGEVIAVRVHFNRRGNAAEAGDTARLKMVVLQMETDVSRPHCLSGPEDEGRPVGSGRADSAMIQLNFGWRVLTHFHT